MCRLKIHAKIFDLATYPSRTAYNERHIKNYNQSINEVFFINKYEEQDFYYSEEHQAASCQLTGL
jgi:hypothetical protein